jgi:YegS/Rv2252/BmrU family lipid kinase
MKLGIIYNPAAGKARRFKALYEYIRQEGHEVALYTTHQPGDATTLTRQAVAEGAEVVVAVGGDGTVNEVIQGMTGLEVPLAVYPAGTTNVWCKQVGMPANPRRATKIICSGPRRTIDLGRVGERYFLLMIGVGLDGEITSAVDLNLKKKIGKLAYALAALQVGLSYRGSQVKLTLNPGSDQSHQINSRTGLIIITNTERYAIMKLAREACLDDGQLELLVFEEKSFWSRLKWALALITNRSEHTRQIGRYRVNQALMQIEKSVGMQIDGDPQGRTNGQPLNIECVPAALKVVVPASAPARLFSGL